MGEIEPLADLAVREALGRQLRDLELLGAQLGPRLGNAPARTLAGGPQLASRALGEPPQAEGVEDAGGLAQRSARIGNDDLAAPGISVGVADVDAVHAKAVEQGFDIVYPLRDEEWGVRRFMLREPSGTVVNVVSHRSD